MSTTSSTATTTSPGLPEDEYINKLIISVEKRPVLYNVHLLDYKNKNKKGEAFKEVQQEMRTAGCSEQQVQGTYKKWISLKRKFRVEFFKSKSEDANSREASCTFPYFEALKFLIPYCEVYKLCKASKRKADDYTNLVSGIDEEESDEEKYAPFEEEPPCSAQNALDLLINQKRVKLECQVNSNVVSSENQIESPTSCSSFLASGAVSSSNTKQHKTKGGAQLDDSTSTNGYQQPFGAVLQDSHRFNGDESQNALFGRLVANELDKLPSNMHNLVRAQVLLLLAQAANTASVGNSSSTTERLLSSFNVFMPP
ncbi:hypothetical protein AAVH_10251 [Aphelenchoides avenae]|nr:hypothetical protein AAVH_10251 [Aphelenchus avenae]